MNNTYKTLHKNKTNKSTLGFTLIELLTVTSIIGILTAIIVPSAFKYITKSKEEICIANCIQVEKMYNIDLLVNGKEHSVIIFSKYITDNNIVVCPAGGIISWYKGNIQCSIHPRFVEEIDDADEEDDNSSGVPFF